MYILNGFIDFYNKHKIGYHNYNSSITAATSFLIIKLIYYLTFVSHIQ